MILHARSLFTIIAATTLSAAGPLCALNAADDPPSAVGPVMRLLKSGRVPPSRVGPIFEQIARRGNEHDLAYLLEQVTSSAAYDPAQRLEVLQLLAEAGSARGVRPAGDLSGIAGLISETADEGESELHVTAVRLAGLWKVASAAEPLQRIVRSEEAPPAARKAALESLAAVGGPRAREVIMELTGDGQPRDVRLGAVAALAGLDLSAAATRGAAVLSAITSDDDPSELVRAFLDRRGGSEQLAAAIEQSPPSADVAKLALRTIYAAGRSDAELTGVLGRIAGIDADPEPPSKREVQQLVQRVIEEGDARRGEEIFRRADLSCMKCHAVSKAGGQVGPDLSAVGASSPVDYLLNSVLDPDQQIKEAFDTRVVMTGEGRVLHGIIVDRTEDRLVLKDADGRDITIPADEIEAEMEGQSLMPRGLTKFMTRSELLDLAKFLSMLGKPGTEYAIRDTQRMQRWRLLRDVPPSFVSEVPAMAPLHSRFGRESNLVPVYSRVNGELPLEELIAQTGQPVVYVMGEVEVTQGGEIDVKPASAEGVTMWVGEQLATGTGLTVALPRGRHRIILRVDTRERSQETLRLELFRAPGSGAEFTVVDGA